MSVRVTAVILNWNGWQDTIACVASLHLMTGIVCRILVVDNGSTDGSVAHIEAAFPGAEVLQTGVNLGFGGGCNAGIRHALAAGADFVWLVNSDATVAPGALAALVRVAERNPVMGAVGSVVFEAGSADQVQLWGGGRVNLWLGRSVHCVAPGRVDFISGASMLLRRAALEDVGLFDEAYFFMYWEDTDLGFRLRKSGWQLAVAADSFLWHKESASLGFGNPVLDAYATRSCVRFLRRHAPMPKLSVGLMLIRMLVKRLLLGRPDRLSAVWRAYRSA
ncbi:MAG: glycosyltransferase family 2 protein [Burkholderiales bacterium]